MAYHLDVDIACGALGVAASEPRQLGMLEWFGNFLGWPDWLTDGTELRGPSRFYRTTSTRDHLWLIANFLEHGFGPSLLDLVCDVGRVPISPSASLLIRKAATLGEIVAVFRTYYTSSARFIHCHHEIDGKMTSLTFSARVPLGALLDFLGAVEVVMFIRILDLFEVKDGLGWAAKVTQSGSLAGPRLKALARGTIEFDAFQNNIAFPTDWEGLKNPTYDPSLQKLRLENRASQGLHFANNDLTQRVQFHVLMTIKNENRVPRLKEVSSIEKLSLRTLNRMLSDTGATYQEIVDSTRRSLISGMITDASVPIRDIAQLTGFSDVSSFGRSFKAWFGDSPSKFRERILD